MVSYTLSRSSSLARVDVVRREFPSYISSIKYFSGDFSTDKMSGKIKRMTSHERKQSYMCFFCYFKDHGGKSGPSFISDQAE